MDKRKSPQEKKLLSYNRDMRNAYGENDKASRKWIPRRKAIEARANRHQVAQSLSRLPQLGEVEADVVESSARHEIERVGGWKKEADRSLADHLKRKASRRAGPSEGP